MPNTITESMGMDTTAPITSPPLDDTTVDIDQPTNTSTTSKDTTSKNTTKSQELTNQSMMYNNDSLFNGQEFHAVGNVVRDFLHTRVTKQVASGNV